MIKYIKNRYVIFALCLILAGVIAFVIVPKSNKNMAELVDVVKVTRQIEKNTQITEDMLEIKQLPKQAVTENTITDKKKIIGKVASVQLLPEDNLVMQKFTDISSVSDKALYEMDGSEKLAISVTVDSLASSVSGKIMPGDVVSVYGFLNETKTLSEYTDLQYVEVIGVSNSSAEELSTRNADSETDSSDKVIPSTVTLSVNRNQAQELVVLENTSNIHIVFVGRGEISRKLLQNN
ncbi:MAG: Flp pilus assembly protein CpaB [Clostridia bacterium]|nr:Flp pilus assembly protein CpaB [Clostridia bacterium]